VTLWATLAAVPQGTMRNWLWFIAIVTAVLCALLIGKWWGSHNATNDIIQKIRARAEQIDQGALES
jgi:type VI protein secretion system component VasK